MNKILIFSYCVFLFIFLFFSYVFIDHNFFYLSKFYSDFFFNERFLTTCLYMFLLIFYFIFYFIFLKHVKNGEINCKNIVILIILTISILLFSYPAMLSYDVFNYLATAKVTFFYQENPYIIMPIQFVNDPLLQFTRASNKIALYGPFWIVLTSIPYLAGFGNYLLTLFAFKLFIVVFYVGTLILIWYLSEKNLFALTFFALNPLIVIETLVDSHNDIVMMFFALLSFWFIFKKRLFLSLLFLFLSVFIKYATIFLLPVFIYMLWKQYLRKQEINFEKAFYMSIALMLVVFFLSSFREEIYPWYAIWFLTFIALVPGKKIIISGTVIFSLSLLLRYIPYMYSGTYAGLTPIIKTMVSFIPSGLFGVYYAIKKKI